MRRRRDKARGARIKCAEGAFIFLSVFYFIAPQALLSVFYFICIFILSRQRRFYPRSA